MLGIFSKRCNRAGAISGMLVGLGTTLVYIFLYKGWFFLKSTAMLPDDAAHWMLGISPGSFGAVGAIFNFAVATIVSRLTDPVPEDVQKMVEDIRIPTGAGSAGAH
jgi:cation/acetate symporter